MHWWAGGKERQGGKSPRRGDVYGYYWVMEVMRTMPQQVAGRIPHSPVHRSCRIVYEVPPSCLRHESGKEGEFMNSLSLSPLDAPVDICPTLI